MHQTHVSSHLSIEAVPCMYVQQNFSHLDNALLAPYRLLELKESSMVTVSTLGRQAFAAEPQNPNNRNCKTMCVRKSTEVKIIGILL